MPLEIEKWYLFNDQFVNMQLYEKYHIIRRGTGGAMDEDL